MRTGSAALRTEEGSGRIAVTCGMDAESNRRAVEWIAEGRLHLKPLLTHVFKPDQSAEAYEMMRTRPGDFLGVAFDWR